MIEQIHKGPDWGKAPDGWREATAKQFAEMALVRIYAPTRYEYRQFQFEGNYFGAQLW